MSDKRRIDLAPHRIAPGATVSLSDIPSDVDGGLTRDDGKDRLKHLQDRAQELQELFFAESKRSLLMVLQAMDTGGKDSTVRQVFSSINPQGVRVWNFKAPTHLELAHDYLWRIHRRVPARGYIGLFNRSHYEDIIAVGVKKLAPKSVWSKRYQHINDFERMLTDEGVTIRKVYLHISKAYQKKRLQRRLDNPDKQWKFNPADLDDRARWEHFERAYETVFERTSTEHAPWYVVPAETRWYRDLLVAEILVQTLESLRIEYPKVTFDPKSIVIK